MNVTITSDEAMKAYGARIGRALEAGQVTELVGDVGAGKTTLVKGIGAGLMIDEDIQSPSFTISRMYDSPSGLSLAHYDFYRLSEPGIMASELEETLTDPTVATVIEWGGIVEGVLPVDRLTITISSPTETSRQLYLEPRGPRSRRLLRELQ